ncbi:uncharacterized protein LOC117179114 [Belonocnema kinseyi]|uniref:uncharacterized protein LOC117179114 n=1 Tax=Belonocnema kinseyi TaxID=2817044 RepID=UPI00143D79C2|nr:uncharacterized protein LOC117179114 [Belonocnema kinseyi]
MMIINMRIFKNLLLMVITFTIIQGHPLSTSVEQDEKGPLSSLAESPVTKTEEKIPETDSLKIDLIKPELPKPDLSLKKQKTVEEPEHKEEPKPETSSDVTPKPEDEIKPSSSSFPMKEPEAPCSSTTDRDCDFVSKPGDYIDRRKIDYDQRQNGTENYRIQVDGLVLVLAPVEALLMAGGMGSEIMNGQFNFSSALDQQIPKGDEQSSNISSKPEFQKPSLHKSARPIFYASPKPVDGPVSIKLINLIAPLLEQRRH